MSDANVPSNTGAPAAPTDQSSNAQQAAAVAQVAGQVLNNPNASQAQKAQAVKQLKSLKIKVDGQEYEEQLPFNMPDTPESRDWMTKNLQMSKVAQKRMGEKAQLENEVRDFLTQLKNDPKKLLSNSTYGVDLKKLAAQMIADYMLMGLKEGLDVTPEDVLPLVREEILEDIRQMAQAMPLETIEKLFGGDILTKIRKKNVSRAKSQPQTASPRLPDVGATKATKTETVNKDKMKTIKQLWGV